MVYLSFFVKTLLGMAVKIGPIKLKYNKRGRDGQIGNLCLNPTHLKSFHVSMTCHLERASQILMEI
jgi:hypothetical protein